MRILSQETGTNIQETEMNIQETETYITLAGVAIMLVLMVAVTWNDIMRVFF